MRSQKTGFALVIALSLMAFVLLLLLSITTLVKVETMSANNTQHQTQARLNALLGLQQALGELQQAAGHDQRVTATGDLWANPAVGTEHFVGVWSSEDTDGNGEPDGSFQRWLVSNNNDSYASGSDRRTDHANFVNQAARIQLDGAGGYQVEAGYESDYVVVVGGGSAAQSSDPAATPIMQGVVARKLPVESGNYAWWVGDNGVKATITQADPYAAGLRTGSDFPVNANMLSMQGSHLGALSNFVSLDYSDQVTVEKLQRSASLSDVELVDSAITSQKLKEYFHDLTTASLGLQTNTQHGGLKRDLSLLFEMSDADFDDPSGDFISEMAAVTDVESDGANVGGDGLVYDAPSPSKAPWVMKDKYALIFKEPVGDPGGRPGDGVIYGPTWDMLRSYYRLYRGVDNKATQPTLKRKWAQTYQPAKAAIAANGGSGKVNNLANMRRFTLGSQGWRDRMGVGSPELVKSTATVNESYWFTNVSSGDTFYPVRPTKGSYIPYLTRITSVLSMTTNEVTTGSDTYNLDVVWQPYLTFHNPYNVSIESPRMRYATEMRYLDVYIKHMEGSTESAPWTVGQEYKVKDVAQYFIYPGRNSTDRVMVRTGKELLFEIPAMTFAPGEVKVFSVPGEVFPDHKNSGSDRFNVLLSASPPNSERDGVHFGLASESLSLEERVEDGWKEMDAADTVGLAEDIPGADIIAVRLKIEKATDFAFDVWNEELGAYDDMIAYKLDSSLLFGNVKWDGQPLGNYELPARRYSGSLLPNLVMDFSVKPLSFDENFNGGSSFINIQNNRKVYPNFIMTNPMASSFHNRANGEIEQQTIASLYHCYAESYSSESAPHPSDKIMELGNGFASWGHNHGSDGPQQSILLDIPTAPMQSIGQFQHATTHAMPYFPVMAVGHSFPSLFVPYSTSTIADLNGSTDPWANGIAYTFKRNYQSRAANEYAFYDLPYLLNEALWDGYYFSSIAPDQSYVDTLYASPSDVEGDAAALESNLSSVVNGFVAGMSGLANSRMQFLAGTVLGASVEDDLTDFRTSANHVAVSGAFNVNSTSLNGWKVLLSGYRDALLQSNQGTVSEVRLASSEAGFPGMSLAPGNANSSSTSIVSDAAWAGFMKLTDAEMETLAAAVVAEIKGRAMFRGGGATPQPVLSLAEFINRINTDDVNYSRGGILQTAIEDAQLNDGLTGLPEQEFKTANFNQNHSPKPYDTPNRDYYPDNDYSIDIRNISPMALTQADILQAIGPVISARSDTFTIRAYGDVEDVVSGEVISQVRCEAVVQRTTEEIGANERRFKVVAFRWLDGDET